MKPTQFITPAQSAHWQPSLYWSHIPSSVQFDESPQKLSSQQYLQVQASSVEDLKRSPQYLVGTPDDVLAALRALPPMAGAVFNPLAGGTPPHLAWPSLELFAGKVLPGLPAL